MPQLKKIYFYFILFSSGLGIYWLRSDTAVILLFIFGLGLVIYEKIFISQSLIKFVAIWLIYFICSTISVGNFHPLFMLIIPTYVLSAYVLIKLFSKDIYLYYERTIYYLALISLFFYCWEVISPTSLYSLASYLDLNRFADKDIFRDQYSLGIYTINHVPNTFPRNSGFCWEPGPFSCFIIIAMIFNAIRTKFTLSNNKIFTVLFLTLLTNLATTGLAILMIFTIWFTLNNNKFRKIALVIMPILIIIIITIFNTTPILKDKIIAEYNQSEQLDELIIRQTNADRAIGPGRFLSFIIAWKDFTKRPLLGYGGSTDLQWTKLEQQSMVFAVSGIGIILAQYGLFGFICWLILILNSAKISSNNQRLKILKFFWLIINLSISFAFSIIISPIFFVFYFMPYFDKSNNTLEITLKKFD